jgi:hypothetical protein
LAGAWGAHAAEVFADDWEGELIFDGTTDVEIPVAAAVRQWSPEGEVFVLFETRRDDAGDWRRDLAISHNTCSIGDECATATVDTSPDAITDAHLADVQLLPSMAIAQYDGERFLHVVRKNRDVDSCDSDGVSYEEETVGSDDYVATGAAEEVWTTDGRGWFAQHVIETVSSSVCDRIGSSFTKFVPSTKAATCYTFDPIDSAGTCRVRCGERPVSSSWSMASIDNDGDSNDHAVWTYLGAAGHVDADQGVALRADLKEINLRYIDTSVTTFGSVEMQRSESPDTETDKADYPWIVRNSGNTLFTTWHEKQDSGEADSLARFYGCTSASDCTDSGALAEQWYGDDWGVPTTIAEGRKIQHVEIAVEGVRQFVIYGADTGGAGDDFMRVYFTWRCDGTEAWETPVKLFEPNVEDWDTMLDFGRPHLVLNRSDDMVHVVFHEQNEDTSDLSDVHDGNVWWLHRPYPSCS